MKTLKELNEKAWYRFSKVVYIALFSLSYLFLVLLGLSEFGREHHPPFYPKTIEIALNDPAFYKFSDNDKKNALKDIDSDFYSLSYTDQEQFIERVKKIDIKTKEIVRTLDDDMLLTLRWFDEYIEGAKEADYSDAENAAYLRSIREKEEGVSSIEDRVFVAVTRKNPIPQEGTEEKYFYASHYTWNIEKSIKFFFIITLCYLLFMAIIRSAFYYVIIGKLFPKE